MGKTRVEQKEYGHYLVLKEKYESEKRMRTPIEVFHLANKLGIYGVELNRYLDSDEYKLSKEK